MAPVPSCRCAQASGSRGGCCDVSTAAQRQWTRLAASPWFASVHEVLERLPGDRLPTLEELNALASERGVASGGGTPLRFVSAAARADDRKQQYEICIHGSGEVETRPNSWHDLFNALVWLAFPRTKATLNRLHHDAIKRWQGEARSGRGTARDVLTLFDEGGMIVACTDPLLGDLLRSFRWRDLFWWRRADVTAQMRFRVFGHAILEHALAPYKAVTAKALIVDIDCRALELPDARLNALLDARAAAYFERPEALASTRTLHPLPVLGIPGWTAANEDPRYYEDTTVFRPGRKAARECSVPLGREHKKQAP